MADAAKDPQSTEESHEDMHWGLHYLRQDLQEHRATTAREFEAVRNMFGRLETQGDGRLDRMDSRFDQVDGRLDRMDSRFDQVDGRLDRMDGRFDQIDGRFDRMDGRLDRAESKLDELQRAISEQGDRLTQRMLLLSGLTTTIILAAIKL